MTTTEIEANERLFVATGEAKGALLRDEQNYFTVAKFVSEKVSMLCDIYQNYEHHIENKGKSTTLCLMLSKASHSTVAEEIL